MPGMLHHPPPPRDGSDGHTDGRAATRLARLLAGCAAGDETAWSEFLALFGPPLEALARKALGPAERDAILEDVVQEALLRLVRSVAKLKARGPAQVVTYLRRTVASVVTDLMRQRHAVKRTGKAGRPPRWEPPDPEEELVQKDAYLRLLARVVAEARHPARDRLIVHGLIVVGWTKREIGPAVGLSASGVDSQLARIRRRNGHRPGRGAGPEAVGGPQRGSPEGADGRPPAAR